MGRIQKSLIALVILSTLIVVLVLVLPFGSRPLQSSMPEPNGYNDFLKAAALLPNTTPDVSRLSDDELRATVAADADALKIARRGLTHECRVPLDFSAGSTNRFEQLACLKRVALAF